MSPVFNFQLTCSKEYSSMENNKLTKQSKLLKNQKKQAQRSVKTSLRLIFKNFFGQYSEKTIIEFVKNTKKYKEVIKCS